MILQIPVEIIATLIAIFAGVAGYAFREYRNRAEPFFVISDIRGGMRRSRDVYGVSQQIRDAISPAVSIPDINEHSNLDEVYQAWRMTSTLKQVWPEMRSRVDDVLGATAESSLLSAMSSLFRLTQSHPFLLTLALRGAIPIEKVDSVLNLELDEPAKLPFWEDVNLDCVFFEFPDGMVRIGDDLDHPAANMKLKSLYSLFSTLDRIRIHALLKEFRARMEQEYSIALSVHEDLKKVLDGRSRWVFLAYFANLSGNPIVLKQTGRVHVKDTNGVCITEECLMARVERNEFDEAIHGEARRPLVVKPSSDLEISFFTSLVQNEMKRGQALRELFEHEEATVTVEVAVEKVGFFKRQSLSSRKAIFAATTPR